MSGDAQPLMEWRLVHTCTLSFSLTFLISLSSSTANVEMEVMKSTIDFTRR